MPDPLDELLKKLRGDIELGGGTGPQPSASPATVPTDESPITVDSTPEEIESFFAESLSELDVPQRDRAEPGRLAKAGAALDFATSGETFLRKASGGRIDIKDLDTPLPDWADKIMEETIDLAANPATLALLVATPIAVPARIAASPIGKLTYRLAAETAASALGVFAIGQAAEHMPANLPTPLKYGLPIVAGIAVGGGSAAAASRAARGANSRVVANMVEQASIRDAKSIGNKWVAPLTDADTVMDAFPKGNTLTKPFFGKTGIDPVVGEGTFAGRSYHVLGRQLGTSQDAAAVSVSAAFPNGLDAFKFSKGEIVNAGERALGKQWNDVFSDLDAPARFGFSKKQTAQWERFNEVTADTQRMRKFHDIETPLLDTDGKLYVPRQVRDAAPGVWEAPSDARLMRVHETATEGAGRGLKYLDPMDTLSLHVESAYREVAMSQFDELIGRIAVPVKSAFGKSAKGQKVIRAKRAADTELRLATKERTALGRKITGISARLSEARRSGTEARVAKLTIELDLKRTQMEKIALPAEAAARRARKDAISLQTQALKSFKNSKKLPGKLFGRREETVPVGKWKESFLPAEDAARLAKWFDVTTGGRVHDATGLAMRTAGDLGDIARTTASTMDFALPFTHLLPTLARDPVTWAKASAQHYLAFFRPGLQGRYLQNNLEGIQRMISSGRVTLGDVEQFSSIQRSGAFGRLGQQVDRLPGGGAVTKATSKTVGKGLRAFERSYNTGLLIARYELWQAMLPTWKGSDESLGALVRNLTGGMDTAAHGVARGQRSLESLLLFSPKLARSTLALVGKAARPWTEEGSEALYTLMRMTAASAGIFTLANIASGLDAGDTDQQIEERVRKGLKPWEGKEFLGFEYNDEWYGIGGQVRAITQFGANAIVGFGNALGVTDEKGMNLDLTSVSENPITSFVLSRSSPFAKDIAAVAELATQEKLNLLPFETIDNTPDLAEVLSTSALPFVVQGYLEEARDPASDPTFSLSVSDFLGARSSVISPFEKRDDLALDKHGMRYKDLDNDQKQTIDDDNPDLMEAISEYGNREEKETRERLMQINANAFATLEILADKLDNTLEISSRKAFRELVEDKLAARAIESRERRASADEDNFAPTTLTGMLLSAYYNTFELSRINPQDDSSGLNHDTLDLLQATLDREIEAGVFGDPEEARAIIDARGRFRTPEELDWYFDNKEVIKDAGYWDVKDSVFETYKARLWQYPEYRDIESAGELEARINQFEFAGNAVAAAKGKAWKKVIDRLTGIQHEGQRFDNQDLDRALRENGYTTTRLNPD